MTAPSSVLRLSLRLGRALVAQNGAAAAGLSAPAAATSTAAAASALLPASALGAAARCTISSSGSRSMMMLAGAAWRQQQLPLALQQLRRQQPPLAGAAAPLTTSAAPRSQCDCPTLGGPEPDVVVVEFDEAEVDRFIAFADAVEEALPGVIVEGNSGGDGRPGAFEVTGPGGALLHSKLGGGGWPEPQLVIEALSAACGTTASKAAAAAQE